MNSTWPSLGLVERKVYTNWKSKALVLDIFARNQDFGSRQRLSRDFGRMATRNYLWQSDTSRSVKPEIDYSSPGLAVMEVERLLFTGRMISSHADEVWPKLYIGDYDSAENRSELTARGFTHIVNCAHTSRRGGPDYYKGMDITYLGIEGRDSPEYDMSANFNTAANFIHKALSGGGKVLVHCHVGVSRSATVVLAYLMLKHHMTLVDAITTVKEGRGIIPNRGFLRQLINLQIQLYGRNSH
ncbi:dual specificity protein phosphatase 26-like isoform X1 [Alosa sapidissima]|uniref:dual specificity protein phosphatase 26-like isoform X1 n=2 Tax=Alosa sapidissima TaxID=34773 RepID=UPI001C08C45E|nr:dual specificity protein phosphatase 26-like isoform X1 [Alosa sapidissima]